MELAVACQSDAPLIRSLLDDYLRELSGHRDLPVGATDAASYRHLDAYWREPGRHAFLIRRGGRTVGFALIRGPASTGSPVHQMAEFYVEPEARRRGIGRDAVIEMWERFPGDWELQVHSRNAGAVRFWSSCVERATGGPPRVREVRGEDGRRLQLDFRVEARRPARR
jgi:predicted acetyltransferase